MDASLGVFAVAFALGVKHAFDADHVVAVSNILARSRSVARSISLSFTWAAGHMVTAGLVTITLVLVKDAFLASLLAKLEWLVVAMLVLAGTLGLLWEAGLLHAHRHDHGGRAHTHVHAHVGRRRDHVAMGGVGIVHGLASNDELLLVLVVVLGLEGIAPALGAVAVFSLGVVAGMAAFAAALAAPFLGGRREGVRRGVTVAASVASIAYAAVMARALLAA